MPNWRPEHNKLQSETTRFIVTTMRLLIHVRANCTLYFAESDAYNCAVK